MNENILIVDDTPENLNLLNRILKDQGYVTRPFPNGRLALQSMEAKKPDLILLDVSMPEMDGYEVCRNIKSNDETKDIPVIFVSALDSSFDKVRAFKSGGVDYITKPFQVEEVEARVKTHLQISNEQKTLEEVLDKTFSATLKLMQEILVSVNEEAFSKGTRIKLIMGRLVQSLKIPHPWQYTMAAVLSQLGQVVTKRETLEKYSSGSQWTCLIPGAGSH